MFQLKIVKVDYYLSRDLINGLDQLYSDFRGTDINQVPVIRIFGITTDGRKACLHVHGFMPYFYISIEKEKLSNNEVFIQQFISELDEKMNVKNKVAINQRWKEIIFVHDVQIVNAINFYGYHQSPEPFLKIYFYDPLSIKKACDLLQSGMIMNHKIAIFESHIPYILKFFIDYNLFGMNFINIDRFKSRQSCIFWNENFDSEIESIQVEKMTSCEIEIDCKVEDILNAKENLNAASSNPGIKCIWEEERKRCELDGLTQTITPKSSQERSNFFVSDFEKEAIAALRQNLETNSQKSNKEISCTFNSQNQINYLSQLLKNASQETFSSFNEQDLVNLVVDLAEHNDQSINDFLNDKIEENLISLELSHTLTDVFNDNKSLIIMPNTSFQVHRSQVINTTQNNNEKEYLNLNHNQLNQHENDDEFELEKDKFDDYDWSFLNSNIIPQLDGSFDVNKFKKKSKRERKYRVNPLPIRVTRANKKKFEFESFSNLLVCKNTKIKNHMSKQKCLKESKISSQKPHKTKENNQERIVKCINDHVVLVERSINHEHLKQIGNEAVLLEPLHHSVIDKLSIISKPEKVCKKSNLKELSLVKSRSYTPKIDKSKDLKLNLSKKNEFTKVIKKKNSKIKTEINNSKNMKSKLNLETSSSSKKSFSPTLPLSVSKINEFSQAEQTNENYFYEKKSHFFLNTNTPEEQVNSELSSNDLVIPSPICLENSFSNLEPLSFIKSNIFGEEEKNKALANESAASVFSFYQYGDTSSIQSSFQSDEELETKHSTPQSGRSKKIKFHSNLYPTSDRNSFVLGTIPENEESIHLVEPLIASFCKSSQDLNKIKNQDKLCLKQKSFDSLIDGVTQKNTFNFDLSSVDEKDKEKNRYSLHQYQFLTFMNVEVLAEVTDEKNPDPMFNPIKAIFYGIGNDTPTCSLFISLIIGVIVIEADFEEFKGLSESILIPVQRKLLARSGFAKEKINVIYANDEIHLFTKLIEIVKTHDPDILFGYEIEFGSWSYLLQRAEALNINIATGLSRIIDERYCRTTSEYDLEFKKGLEVPGRIVLNLWRIIRKEVILNMYSYENVHFHILHERIPSYSFKTLNDLFEDSRNINRWRVIEYFLLRIEGCHKLIEKLNIIPKTSELARLFGIQFFEVFSRGSQFRVESMLLRAAKLFNYVMISHTPIERARMKAPEVIPLVMEPESKFYPDPVVVLDFQSLYPSVMIAYNYCYSTCLGRVDYHPSNEPFEFGCSSLCVPSFQLKQNLDHIHVSPNGVAFLKPNIRKGILSKMLEEILNTRIMVKNSIKEHSKKSNPNKLLLKLLNARQLGLKLISNVTSGYTNANFSGRMPCVEIADAIISKGREILTRAIEFVNNNKEKWGGRVIYGDTDSLFILFENMSREDAFEKGQEIAQSITQNNPYPIKLKFEKVYQPCLLQAKKRYAGFMYENKEQVEPILESKGLETIRRDTCPAASKILEKCLRILFTTHDVENNVRPYVVKQFQKILKGRISCMQDFIFAREFGGFEKYRPNACVPALKIAKKLKEVNPRGVPKQGERVPYVIVNGALDQPLIQLVRQPNELIKNSYLQLNSIYYIQRVIIPTLNRVFQILGFDVMDWYKKMSKKLTFQKSLFLNAKQTLNQPQTLHKYFSPQQCPVCDKKTMANDEICPDCLKNSQTSVIVISEKIKSYENKFSAVVKICQSCNGNNDIIQDCNSIECSNYFRYNQAKLDLSNVNYLNQLLNKFSID